MATTEKPNTIENKISGLEKALADFYSKTITLKLPPNAVKWLAENVWWIVLIGGILSLASAWNYWNASRYIDAASDLARSVGVEPVSASLNIFWYIALAGIIAQAILFLLAFQPLKEGKKKGWNLVFYASLISVAVGVVFLFASTYGFGSLIGTVIAALIGWFFLFQIRSKFVK